MALKKVALIRDFFYFLKAEKQNKFRSVRYELR